MKTAREVAKSWVHKAKEEKDPFDKFVYLWFAFNALYGQYLEKEDDKEKYLICTCSKDYLKQVPRRNLQSILNKDYVRFFENRIIRDCRRKSGKDTRENVSSLKNTSNTLSYRVTSLLLILYQVRCNLFHGDKMYERDSDQEVIKNAADAL